MRFYILNFLKGLSVGGKEVTDQDIINWANNKVAASGKPGAISTGFKDKHIANGRFLIDLLNACDSRSINYDYVTPGETDQQKQDNAKYAIGCARKMGCTVFLLWEDIVEVQPKMIMTFVAAIMQQFGSDAPRTAASS